ncbi:MAG: hypothetical protein RL385_5165 [Pseudomonadota bacterium]|jgi:hypothetical protein
MQTDVPRGAGVTPIVRWGSIALLSAGIVARMAPLADQGGRLLRQFPTEDGYLMLTIARNLARGLGMSTADGALLTNGTQPLTTFLWALPFLLVDGDRTGALYLVQGAEVLVAVACAYLLHRLTRQVFADATDARPIAWLAPALWFGSPVVLPHTMNCLETGPYMLTLLVAALAITRCARATSPDPDYASYALLGASLGVAFWARNDAVLLCISVGLVHLLRGLGAGKKPLRARFFELLLTALVVLSMAAPWLLFNLRNFGHLVPISGQAESLEARFAENLPTLPATLLEAIFLFVPVPQRLEAVPAFAALSTLFVVVVVWRIVRAGRSAAQLQRELLLVSGVFALLLASFYGLFFGAGWFLSRYFAVLTPFTAIVMAVWIVRSHVHFPQVFRAALPLAIALGLLVHLRNYAHGSEHQHFQVVEWVGDNVPRDVWVGAVQSGTLGFFHDRTINLDGKVNPEALGARRTTGIPAYVAERPIAYLVDWYNLLDWANQPEVARHYEVSVADAGKNLTVFRRVSQEPTKVGFVVPNETLP